MEYDKERTEASVNPNNCNHPTTSRYIEKETEVDGDRLHFSEKCGKCDSSRYVVAEATHSNEEFEQFETSIETISYLEVEEAVKEVINSFGVEVIFQGIGELRYVPYEIDAIGGWED